MHRLKDHPASWAYREAVRCYQPGHHRCGQRDKREDTGVGEEEPLEIPSDGRAPGGPARCGQAGPVGKQDCDQGPGRTVRPGSPGNRQDPTPGWHWFNISPPPGAAVG